MKLTSTQNGIIQQIPRITVRHCLMMGFFALLLILSSAAHANELFLVASNSNPIYSNPQGTGLIDRLATVVFSRIGWRVTINHQPSERALINANEGLDDGELFRIADKIITDKYPNLILVPEPWMIKEFSAFTNLDKEVTITDWKDLREYSVAFIKGWRLFEENTKEVKLLTKVEDDRQLFELIQNHRADIILFDRLQGHFFLKKSGLKEIRLVAPPLAVKELHLYLNKKHAALVEPVSQVLRAIKADGSYQKLVEQGINELDP